MSSSSSPAAGSVDRRRGRPIVGTIFGFLLGVFVALDLILFGILPLESGLVWLFIAVGTALGLGLGWWAPFGRAKGGPVASSPEVDDSAAAPAVADDPGQDDSASTTSEGA